MRKLIVALLVAASMVLFGTTAGASTPKLQAASPGTARSGTNYCIGESSSCVAVFPAPDLWDATAILVGKVYLDVSCPDPGVCDQPVGDQLDAVLVGLSTGSSGMTDPGVESRNVSLVLPDGSQAKEDSITCDSSVEYALCGLGPEGPNVSFSAVVYFDAPDGTSYQQVNFAYYSSAGTETVYTFTPTTTSTPTTPTTPSKGSGVATRYVAARGGAVKWVTTVSKAGWCIWSSSPRLPKFNGSVRCHNGKVQRTGVIKANTGGQTKTYMFKLKVLGLTAKTKTKTYYLKVVEYCNIQKCHL